MPGGLHPHAHADSSLLQFSVVLLSFSVAVIQLPFIALLCFLIQKSNVLKARMKIYSYNDHVGSFLPSLGRQTTTVYSGRGSQHCYEINWFSLDFQLSGSMHDSDSEAPSYNISRRNFPCPYQSRVPCLFSPSSTSPDPLRFTATRWDLTWPTPRSLSLMPRMTTDGQCCGSMAWS